MRQEEITETVSVDRNWVQELSLDTGHQEVGKMRTLIVMTSEGGERQNPKVEMVLEEGESNLIKCYKGSRNGRTDMTLGLHRTGVIGDLDRSILQRTGREACVVSKGSKKQSEMMKKSWRWMVVMVT